MKRLLIILFASFCLSPHLGLAAAPPDAVEVQFFVADHKGREAVGQSVARSFFNPHDWRS